MREIAVAIVQYEAGELNGDETIALFQALLDSGVIFSLQGSYQRTATELVSLGYCVPPGATPRRLENN